MTEPGGLKLPGVGKVSRKWVMIVGGASVVSIGYFLYRRKQAAAAAAAAPASTDTADTSGQLDPLTGDVAGSEQDQMDLAALQAGGYGNSLDSGLGSSVGDYGGYLAASPAGSAIPGAGGFATNGEWAQQAETDLGGIGIDQSALSAALGNYLTGRPLTTDQQSLVDQARAEEGDPPVAGAGGYPPAMHATATGGGSGGSGGTGGTSPPGAALPAPAGLKDSAQADSVTLRWASVPGASQYHYQITSTSGASVHDARTASSGAQVSGLKPKTRYGWRVAADATAARKSSAWSHGSSFTTK